MHFQGTLTKGESSAQLTVQLVFVKKEKYSLSKKSSLYELFEIQGGQPY